jgi:hypothetical protein
MCNLLSSASLCGAANHFFPVFKSPATVVLTASIAAAISKSMKSNFVNNKTSVLSIYLSSKIVSRPRLKLTNDGLYLLSQKCDQYTFCLCEVEKNVGY